VPFAICERFNAQFRSNNSSQDHALAEIVETFNANTFKPVDSSQNAMRIVRAEDQ
jgi:hypothetical protein